MNKISNIRESLGTVEIRLTEGAAVEFYRFGPTKGIKGIKEEAAALGFELGEYSAESHGRIWFKK